MSTYEQVQVALTQQDCVWGRREKKTAQNDSLQGYRFQFVLYLFDQHAFVHTCLCTWETNEQEWLHVELATANSY